MYYCWEREHLWQDVISSNDVSLSAGPRLHRQSHELSPRCSLGLREICPIRLCSDSGWNSVSEDCNHRATPVNPYWSQELTQAGFLFRQLHLMVILIILQGIAVPGTLTGILQFQSPLPVHSLLKLWSTTVFQTQATTSARSCSSDEMTDIGLTPNRKRRAFPAHAGVCLCCWFSIHHWDTSSCHGDPVLRDWVMLQLFLPVHLVRVPRSGAGGSKVSMFDWKPLQRAFPQFTVSPRVTCSASLSSFGIVRF